MPKDEFDFDDPLELNGIAMLTHEDTSDDMTECFIEEFMRLGHNHKQILAMFRNKHYIGMHMVLENRGEDYIKRRIQEVFAQWGRAFEWGACTCGKPHSPHDADTSATTVVSEQQIQVDPSAVDPTGAPIPKLHP